MLTHTQLLDVLCLLLAAHRFCTVINFNLSVVFNRYYIFITTWASSASQGMPLVKRSSCLRLAKSTCGDEAADGE